MYQRCQNETFSAIHFCRKKKVTMSKPIISLASHLHVSERCHSNRYCFFCKLIRRCFSLFFFSSTESLNMMHDCRVFLYWSHPHIAHYYPLRRKKQFINGKTKLPIHIIHWHSTVHRVYWWLLLWDLNGQFIRAFFHRLNVCVDQEFTFTLRYKNYTFDHYCLVS